MDDKPKTYTEDQLKYWNEQYEAALKAYPNSPNTAANVADWALYFRDRGPTEPKQKELVSANATP